MKTQGERGSQVCKEVSRVTRLSIHMVEANIPITIKDFFDGLQKWTGSIRSYHFVWDKLCHTKRFLIPSLQARSKPWYKPQSAARGIEHIPIFIQETTTSPTLSVSDQAISFGHSWTLARSIRIEFKPKWCRVEIYFDNVSVLQFLSCTFGKFISWFNRC